MTQTRKFAAFEFSVEVCGTEIISRVNSSAEYTKVFDLETAPTNLKQPFNFGS